MTAPPATDRIVVALWRSGETQAAIEVALAAIARSDPRRLACQDALDRMRRGEHLEGEPAALDFPLVSLLLEQARLYEARSVLRGGRIAGSAAQRLGQILDQALAPFPPDADPSFGAVHHLIGAGQASSALRAMEELATQPQSPAWLAQRVQALAAIVRGTWKHEPATIEPATRQTVLAKLRARDMPGALRAAHEAGATELAAILLRLLDATERILNDSMPDQGDDPETVPMQGNRIADFHVRVGVLDQADREYRAILRQREDDEHARAMLADVIALRRTLGEETEPMPVRANAAVQALKKNAPRTGGQTWASGARGAPAQAWDTDSTASLPAADEAELLLKLGKAQQALDMYRILAIRHPKQQAYRKRIAEIEALIAQRVTPMAAEVTVCTDLSELSLAAIPTNPRAELEHEHPSYAEDEDAPTSVDKMPNRE